MTKLNTEQEALVDLAGKKWASYKAEASGVEARIRARVEKEAGETLRAAKLEVAEALRVALDAGATKVSLKRVTSKNPGTLEAFLELLTEGEPEEAAAVSTADALRIEWGDDPDELYITLDSRSVRETDLSRDKVDLWEGLFEVYERPGDGRVLIDPVENTLAATDEHGVTEWLRADRANEEVVIQWVKDNQR